MDPEVGQDVLLEDEVEWNVEAAFEDHRGSDPFESE